MEISININKQAVYKEVAQTSSYTGAKMTDEDPKAYNRISTTDEDSSQLERFWHESRATVCEELKRNLKSERTYHDTGDWELKLEVSSAFDNALLSSIHQDLFSFFVLNITSKWYAFTNKKEAGDYGAAAAVALESVHRKVCYKKRPTRPVY